MMKRSKWTRIISVVLILTLVFTQYVSVFDIKAEDTNTQEEQMIQPSEVEPEVDNEYKKDPLLKLPETTTVVEDEVEGELISIGEYTKLYKTGDKTYKTVVTSIPNTYKDTLGNQHEIDNTLEKKSSLFSGTYFTNKANDLNVELPAEITGNKGITVSKNGVELKLIPIDGDYTNAAVKDNAILYNNVYDGIDVQYTVSELAVKEDIILNKYVENNTFRFCVEASDVELRLEEGVINVYKWDQEEPVMQLSAPMMSDAAGALSENITLSLEKSLGSNIITITADKEWLSDISRAFPIKIDPTVGAVTVHKDGINIITTSSLKGTNDGKAYGYVGYITDDDIGMSGAGDFGQTRMYIQVNSNYFNSIPINAEVKSANLYLYEYRDYSNSSTLLCSYALKENWPALLTWSNSIDLSREPSGDTYEDPINPGEMLSSVSVSKRDYQHKFNVTETVNNWIKGVLTNNGLMIKANDEFDSVKGGAFYTSISTATHNGQSDFTEDKAPRIEIDWYIPGDVPDIDISDVSINLRPISESSIQGKLKFNGIFVDGIAKPGSTVSYSLNDTSKSQAGTVDAGYWFAYPDSSSFDSFFPYSNKYRYKKSNWQSTQVFTNIDFNTLYYYNAFATLDGVSGSVKSSETFSVYKIKQFDTIPNIANYYGVNLSTLMFDNRVQDSLLVENNTLFIRNPQKNATVPYNPAPLSDVEKRKIDGALMGRGLHCEFGFEPININTGNFYLNTEDVTIPDYNGDFVVERNYNSKGAAYNSMFGRGWSFNYDERLSILEDGSILYSRSDGSTVCFTPDGNGNYIAPDGVYLNLNKIAVSTKTVDYGNDEVVTYTTYEYEIKEADNTVRRFNSYGQLSKITDSKGFITEVKYDENYKLSAVVSPSGKQYSITTNADGKITGITIPNGSTLKYAYDANDNLISYTDATGNVTSYSYDSKHQMISWFDGNGTKIIENTYDNEGRVTSQKDGEGKISTLEYSSGQTKTTDEEGNVTIYNYDSQYRTTKVQYADGSTIQKGYDSENNLAFEIDQMGNRTSYTYDAKGNTTKITRFDGKTRKYTYNQFNKMSTFTDYDNKINTYEYDGAGNLTKITYNDGTFSQYTYDNLGRLLSYTDMAGNVTSYAYNGVWLSEQTNAAGDKTQYTYNTLGQISTIIDANGKITRYMYDNAGRKVGEQNANGEYTQYVYDAGGLCIAIIDPKGYRTDVKYSKADDIIKVIDPMNNVYTYTYDALGNKLSQTDPDGKITKYEYDSLSRVIKEINPDGGIISYVYDALGNVIETKDQNGNITKIEYDYRTIQANKITEVDGSSTVIKYNEVGLPISQTYADNSSVSMTYDTVNRLKTYTDQLGLSTEYSYDANGNMLSISDEAGRNYTYVYNQLNLCTEQITPNGAKTKAVYDKIGNLTQITDALGGITKLSYDAAGRMTGYTDANNTTKKYEYDLNGNLIKQIDANGKVTVNSYDPLDRITVSTNAKSASQQITYDLGGNIASVKNALGALSNYTYNGLGLPLTFTDAEGNEYTYKYDQAGNNTEITAPDDTKTSLEYDSKNRLIKVVYATGLELSYEYDKLSRVIEESDNAGSKTQYSYDEKGNLISATDSLGQITKYAYDLAGNLIQVTGYDGNKTKYEYDKEGNVIAITDAENKTTTYQYNLLGNLITSEDASHRTWSYTYDKIGQLTKYVDPLGATTSYEYDKTGNLLSFTDALGSKESYIYDEVGNLVSITDKNGNASTLVYDAIGRVIKQTAADGGLTEYLYDNLDRIIKQKDPLGNVTQYDYDNVGNLISQTTPNSGVYQYAYNAVGLQTKVTDPLGSTTNYSYDILGQLTEKKLANGALYTYNYDAIGRITNSSAPNGQAVNYNYDERGDLVKQTDATSRTVEYSYDDMHRLISTVNPNGQKTAYSYDSNGNLQNIASPLGSKYSYQYDALDRITEETNPQGTVTNYAYDLLGNLESITKAGGRVTSYDYDKNGNLISTTNALNQTSSYAYDSVNRLTTETDAAGGKTSYGYDLNGCLTSITDANGAVTSMTYDKNSNMISVSDANGSTTSYAYDLADRLVSVTDGIGAKTSYSYDSVGNLKSKTDAGSNTTSYTYDKESNLTSITNPLGQIQSFTYDINGNLTTYMRPDGKIMSYDYDKLDALTTKDYATSNDVALYAYDEDGNLVSMDDSLGETTYEYDSLGQVTKVIGSDGNAVAYSYDIYGNLSAITYPDGESVKYEYDALDQLIKVTDRSGEITEYKYDTKGNLTETIRPNGTKSKAVYNALNQLTSMTNYAKDASIISNFEYTYSLAGDIIREIATQDDIKYDRSFTYTARGEIHTVTEVNDDVKTLIRYTYDQSGNRLKMTENIDGTERVVDYTYDTANKLTKAVDSINGTTDYKYDINGNLEKEKLGSQVTHYKYTDENRLESVRQNGTLLMAALYDGNGDRVFMVDRYTSDYIEIIEYTKKPEKEEKEKKENKNEVESESNKINSGQSNTRNNTETPETPENTTDDDAQLLEDTSNRNKNNNNNSNNVDDSKVPAILKKLDTPEQVIFWYGFGQSIVNSLRLFGFNYSKELDEMFDATWDYVNKKNSTLAKKNNNGKDTDTVTVGTVSNENAKVKEKVLLPYKVKDKELDEYKITSYINDVNSEYTQVLMEYGTDGEVSSVYEYGYQRNSYTTSEGKSYYQYDGRGSVSNLTSQSGESMVSYSYDAYGQASATSVSDNLYLYNAEKTDMGTGYQYLRARYYDSGVGRFTTQDSYSGNINSPLSQNLYIYVENNPLMYVDPSGYFFKEIFGGVAGAVTSVVKGVKGLVTGKGTSGFSSGWSSGYSAGSKVGQSWDNNIVSAFTSSKKTSLKQEEINNIINVGIGSANTAQEGFYAGKSNEQILKEIEEKKRKLCEEAKYAEKQELVDYGSFFKKSANQFVAGGYTDDVTWLGTVAQVGTGLAGVDLPMDIRDISADIVNWEWSWGHAGRTLIDVAALIPLVGAMKYSDEIATLLKQSDEAASVIKGLDNSTYEYYQDIVKNIDIPKYTNDVTNGGTEVVTKPNQLHHYASNKNKTYTPQFEEIGKKYDLDLNNSWNKELLPHQGRHPNEYHEYVLDGMKQFDEIAQGDKDIFLNLYESMKKNISSNPDMLYKDYWKK